MSLISFDLTIELYHDELNLITLYNKPLLPPTLYGIGEHLYSTKSFVLILHLFIAILSRQLQLIFHLLLLCVQVADADDDDVDDDVGCSLLSVALLQCTFTHWSHIATT